MQEEQELVSVVGDGRARVNAHLRAFAEEFAAGDPSDLTWVRALVRRLALDPTPHPDTTFVPVVHEAVRGTWVIPRGASPARRVVYCHGCSLMAGDLHLYGGFVSRLAAAAGACVLFVDYRLAPEHHFPAAHEDCAAALFWAMDHGPGEERPAATCYVAGDSAGASPGLNAAIAATRRGRPPAGVALFSPFVDLTVSGASAFENDGRDPLTTTAIARACAPLYAPGMDPADPRLSPLFDDLRVLPPLHIQGSMNDPLLDDAVRLAERVRRSGGQVALHLWEEVPHTWYLFPDALRAAALGIEVAGAFLQSR
jgi:acetyl esterase/lipase